MIIKTGISFRDTKDGGFRELSRPTDPRELEVCDIV
jgi:hypothetical protein